MCASGQQKKSQIFSGIYSTATYSPNNVMEITVPKENSRSGVDTPSSGLADPTPSPGCPIPAVEPADARLGHQVSSGGARAWLLSGTDGWLERTWVKSAQGNLRSPRTHSCTEML